MQSRVKKALKFCLTMNLYIPHFIGQKDLEMVPTYLIKTKKHNIIIYDMLFLL